MSLTKKVYLTISGYDIKLSDNLMFYQNDQLKLIFYINEYGIDYENNATTRVLMPVNPLNAILFIENPDGVDSVSSAKIEDNAVTFYLDSTHTQYVGISRMQLRLFDQDGCAITLPHFTFEIRENIYGSGDVRFQNVVMVDQTGTVILTEDNDLLDVGDILTMGTEVAYPQVTKTIKELPIKHGLDGTEKLIVEDNEATKQAPLGTIVDEIKQNSQEKIREIESELNQTNAQLSHLAKHTQGWVNVAELGAKLDGLNDDTDFLIEAHEIVENGGKILIPTGKLLITRPVVFTKAITLEGINKGTFNESVGSCIYEKNNATLIFQGTGSKICDLLVSGDRGETTGDGVIMICARPCIQNVTVLNQSFGNGVTIGSEKDEINVNSWYVDNLMCRQNMNGLFIGDGNATASNSNAGCATKLDCSYNSNIGIIIKNSFDNNFLSSHIERNGEIGIKLINASGHTFIKPYIEQESIGVFGDETSFRNHFIGHRRDGNIFEFLNTENYYDEYVLSKGMFNVRNLFRVFRHVITNKTTSGVWELSQKQNDRNLTIELTGTSAEGRVRIQHSNEEKRVIIDSQGLAFNGGQQGISNILVGRRTLNFGDISAGATKKVDFMLTGVTSDFNTIVKPEVITEGLIYQSFATSDDVVSVTVTNTTSGTVPVRNVGFRILALKGETSFGI